MIKLELTPEPNKLTDELISSKTEQFKADATQRVWDIDWLKEAIASLAYGKCCYTEIPLGEESKYMEVEHFHPKSLYPDEVLAWGNLLPSCKKCNAVKGEHDTVKEPIVNPFIDNPKDYFYIDQAFYRAKNQSEKAKLSIEKLGLNDLNHFVKPRMKVGNQIILTISDLKEDIFSNDSRLPVYIKRLKRLMKEGGRTEKYAALVSTVILSDKNFMDIENHLTAQKLWDTELTALKEELEYCSLIK